MKTLLLFLGLSVLNFGYCQDELPKAHISKTVNNSITEYSFKSNYYIPEWKTPQLADRLKNRYSEIKTISIDSETQIITLSLNDDVKNDEFLKAFVKHFKYSGYEIN